MWCSSLPLDPNRNQQHSDDQWRKNLCGTPSSSKAPDDGEWDEYAPEDADGKDDPDYIELPVKSLGHVSSTVLLEWCFTNLETSSSFCLVADPPERTDQR